MADNYLERQYEDYLRQKAIREKAKQKSWKKQLKEYQEKMRRQNGQS